MSSTTTGLYAKVLIDDNGLTGVDAAALEAEYKARVKARIKKKHKPAEANPRAKEAGSSEHDAATRQRRADRRQAKVHEVRNKRAAKERADQEEAFRRVKAQARQQPSAGQPRSGTRTGTGSRRKSRRSSGRSRSSQGGMAVHYKVLDLPNGASRSEVKSAFRKLMRKYHPDMHTQSPKKHKAATELTMKVSAAYNALEEHFRANE